MDKEKANIVVVAVVIVVAAVAGYLYWKNKPTTAPAPASVAESAADAAEAAAENATKGVLPSIEGATNPLENKPVVNPVDVSNPFKSVKTNPFQ